MSDGTDAALLKLNSTCQLALNHPSTGSSPWYIITFLLYFTVFLPSHYSFSVFVTFLPCSNHFAYFTCLIIVMERNFSLPLRNSYYYGYLRWLTYGIRNWIDVSYLESGHSLTSIREILILCAVFLCFHWHNYSANMT